MHNLNLNSHFNELPCKTTSRFKLSNVLTQHDGVMSATQIPGFRDGLSDVDCVCITMENKTEKMTLLTFFVAEEVFCP